MSNFIEQLTLSIDDDTRQPETVPAPPNGDVCNFCGNIRSVCKGRKTLPMPLEAALKKYSFLNKNKKTKQSKLSLQTDSE